MQYGALALLVVGVGAGSMYYFERQHWISTVAEIYRVHALSLIRAEFDNLHSAIFDIADNQYIDFSSKKNDSQPLLQSLQQTHYSKPSAVIVQDQHGALLYGEAVLGEAMLDALLPLHQSIDTSPFKARRDTGVDFIEGRVFLYSSELIVTPENRVVQVTLFKEAGNELLLNLSERLGQKIELIHKSASLRVTQISYTKGYKLVASNIRHEPNTMVVEYSTILDSGRVQPADLAVSIHLDSYELFSPMFFFGFILISLLLISWFSWQSIWNQIVKPTFKHVDTITDVETHTGQKEDLDSASLPKELKNLHESFASMYSSMAEQNNFSNLLVDAIGDVIITVDKEGVIRYINPAAEHWLGFAEEKIHGQPIDLYINNLDDRSSNVQQWIYKSNEKKQRTQCRSIISSLAKHHKAYVVDVICQPLTLMTNQEYQSTSVLVIRIKDRIDIDPYSAKFSASIYTNH
ncbi:PAS domain-containing protein [Vibrio maerlii]|uniref:PAS domain-containing protein n=1 Tax=Vibrio maerlii TaxID=2231648 RepID=UPI0013DFFF95|nr:PAS domain-containing protein [Vibrio maerlii]